MMKGVERKSFFLFFFLILVKGSFNLSSENEQERRIQERAAGVFFKPLQQFKKIVTSEEAIAGIPDVIANVGSLASIATLDYSKPPKQVMKEIGDAVIPVISVGLAVIPGGALIGGVVSAIWGLFSPFLGGGDEKSPMEKMIDEIKEEINAIRDEIKEMAVKITEKTRKERNDALKKIISKAIHGEIQRNQYICQKYAVISSDFSNKTKTNTTIPESLRVEMIALINDCDNFLKDTATAFVYPEYADALWVPSVMTTLVRVGFLAEVCNYGKELGLDAELLRMFWAEMKNDIKRTFELSAEGARKRLVSMIGHNIQIKLDFTQTEYEGCRMQQQLLYFDRQMYPYGVPKHFRIFGDTSELNIKKYLTTGSNKHVHIQVYYNEYKKVRTQYANEILNCMMGAEMVTRVPSARLFFKVTYVANKSYQLRLLYFTKQSKYGLESWDEKELKELGTYDGSSNRKVTINTSSMDLKIKVKKGSPNPNNPRRFLVKTGYHEMKCTSWNPYEQHLGDIKCFSNRFAYSGNYVLEDVAAFDVPAGEDIKGSIDIETGDSSSTTLILGVEFIVSDLSSK